MKDSPSTVDDLSFSWGESGLWADDYLEEEAAEGHSSSSDAVGSESHTSSSEERCCSTCGFLTTGAAGECRKCGDGTIPLAADNPECDFVRKNDDNDARNHLAPLNTQLNNAVTENRPIRGPRDVENAFEKESGCRQLMKMLQSTDASMYQVQNLIIDGVLRTSLVTKLKPYHIDTLATLFDTRQSHEDFKAFVQYLFMVDEKFVSSQETSTVAQIIPALARHESSMRQLVDLVLQGFYDCAVRAPQMTCATIRSLKRSEMCQVIQVIDNNPRSLQDSSLCTVLQCICQSARDIARINLVEAIRRHGAIPKLSSWAQENPSANEAIVVYDKGANSFFTLPIDDTSVTVNRNDWIVNRGRVELASVCIGFQNGSCRATESCNMIHVDRRLIKRLRPSSCCGFHDEVNKCNLESLQHLGPSLVVRADVEHNIPLNRFAFTLGLSKLSSHTVSEKRVCRQHQKSACGKPLSCKFIHICRETAKEIGICDFGEEKKPDTCPAHLVNVPLQVLLNEHGMDHLYYSCVNDAQVRTTSDLYQAIHACKYRGLPPSDKRKLKMIFRDAARKVGTHQSGYSQQNQNGQHGHHGGGSFNGHHGKGWHGNNGQNKRRHGNRGGHHHHHHHHHHGNNSAMSVNANVVHNNQFQHHQAPAQMQTPQQPVMHHNDPYSYSHPQHDYPYHMQHPHSQHYHRQPCYPQHPIPASGY
eukprot:TRINITY_DN2533_c0_g1_i1.p1 TRINITY_DN2533_c0_g1~~TRINITY_DN2533_c0_g1_i1.p1  ORF type:complete len:700 (+),score=115.95 TRINITY_DN2533_c0_g1_i1:96-2195(+)